MFSEWELLREVKFDSSELGVVMVVVVIMVSVVTTKHVVTVVVGTPEQQQGLDGGVSAIAKCWSPGLAHAEHRKYRLRGDTSQ